MCRCAITRYNPAPLIHLKFIRRVGVDAWKLEAAMRSLAVSNTRGGKGDVSLPPDSLPSGDVAARVYLFPLIYSHRCERGLRADNNTIALMLNKYRERSATRRATAIIDFMLDRGSKCKSAFISCDIVCITNAGKSNVCKFRAIHQRQ